MLHNVRTIPAVSLTGVNGVTFITEMGDLNFWAKGHDGAYHCTLLEGVLLHEQSPVNLISVDQVSEAGGKSQFGKKPTDNFVSFESPDGEVRLMLEKINGIHAFFCQIPELNEDEESDVEDEDSEINGPQMVWMGEVNGPSLE